VLPLHRWTPLYAIVTLPTSTKGKPMKRYTLNERGRIIWIETPIFAAVILLTCTNALEVIARWIMGY
jgi:hypothetical protein